VSQPPLTTSLLTRLPRGIVLRDPLLLASGCCGYGEEYAEIVDPASFGGVITKAVSPQPRLGNSLPRLRETPAGLLNCIGLQNPGVEKFAAEIMPRLSAKGITYIVNAVGKTCEHFAEVVARCEQGREAAAAALPPDRIGDGVTVGFAGYELDLSCPNVESGTMFATDCELLARTVALCRAKTEALIVAKLSPNVTDIVMYARLARESGADAVTISNTLNGVSIDIRTRKSHLARPSAGLSGAAIRPAVLYHVWRCKSALPDLPILGSGGIMDTDSALQFLLAGADALQLGTGLFVNPALPRELQAGISAYLLDQGEREVNTIVGAYKG
jgi:dihydroorotate dehydrogenase (NAD+) catalytic subunit